MAEDHFHSWRRPSTRARGGGPPLELVAELVAEEGGQSSRL